VTAKDISTAPVLLCGSPRFAQRTTNEILKAQISLTIRSCTYAECWSTVLSERPQYLVIEIGRLFQHETLRLMRETLTTLRSRSGNELKIVLALTSSQTLHAAGELLFEENTSEPSSLINDMIASPPLNSVDTLDIGQQLIQIIQLDYERVTQLGPQHAALPALNDRSWVPSMADPKSRELWCRWLPRFALYNDENPIIIGPTGTGKTNLARAVHALSGRSGEFISITPRDFSSSELVQAELFGAVEGAYTGAVDKWGLVRSAQKGTLFIDELQSIDKDLQGKLITFIENKAYRRVGGTESISADVRFVFATNRSLTDMMEDDTLRHDFAYRLERVMLQLQLLALRPLDIVSAVAFSIAKIRRQRPHMMAVTGFEPDALASIMSASWPGNLRQLENAIAKACELADIERSSLISLRHIREILPIAPDMQSRSATWLSELVSQHLSRSGPTNSLWEQFGALRRALIREAYYRNDENLSKTAEELGTSPASLKLFL
jgi:transcriptional regulator with AAA-type ATPase domain